MSSINVAIPRNPMEKLRFLERVAQAGYPLSTATQEITQPSADKYIKGGFKALASVSTNKVFDAKAADQLGPKMSVMQTLLGSVGKSREADAHATINDAVGWLKTHTESMLYSSSTTMTAADAEVYANALFDTAKVLREATSPRTLGAADRVHFDLLKGALAEYCEVLSRHSCSIPLFQKEVITGGFIVPPFTSEWVDRIDEKAYKQVLETLFNEVPISMGLLTTRAPIYRERNRLVVGERV